jgi:hypothetical protein
MKKEKFNITLAILIVTILSYSCSEDFLNRKPVTNLTEQNYFKDVDELETGLMACYGAIGSFAGFEADLWTNGNIGSDDSEKGSEASDMADLQEISFSRQTAKNEVVWSAWHDCYQVIARCNEVIYKSLACQGDSIAIEKIVDQAKYIRALCYYHLVVAFGDVPLLTRPLAPSELTLKRSPAAEVWELIEKDLGDASNLPSKSQWNESGRITSGAVCSLLGKVLLTQKKYSLANSAFHKVVLSGEYQLVPDFGFIFRHEGENCDESIFEIQRKSDVPGGAIGTWSGPTRMPRDQWDQWGFDCPTADLFKEFESGDPRIIYTFIFKGDVIPIDAENTYTVVNKDSPSGYNSRKAWIPFSERVGFDWYQYDLNYRYMRYSEVLLLYAEALNEVNNPDSARMFVNMVRERARTTTIIDPQRISCAFPLPHPANLLPDITTNDKAELQQAIWHEQRVELAMEGHRRNILMRTGRFKVRMEEAKGSKGCTVEDHEWLYPIPQDEIDVSNGQLSQNPGY